MTTNPIHDGRAARAAAIRVELQQLRNRYADAVRQWLLDTDDYQLGAQVDALSEQLDQLTDDLYDLEANPDGA